MRDKGCPLCKSGELSIKFSKYGAFAGCSNYPECKFTKTITEDNNDSLPENKDDLNNILGVDESLKLNIYLKKGPYGHYIQLGEDSKGKDKPKRVQIPNFINLDNVDLDLAKKLIGLPKELGIHPDTYQPIYLGIGKFGPYILHDKKYTSASKDIIFLNTDLTQALNLINKIKTIKAKSEPLKILTSGDDKIEIFDGRYGAYIKYNKKNIAIPKNINPHDMDYDRAKIIIQSFQEKNN